MCPGFCKINKNSAVKAYHPSESTVAIIHISLHVIRNPVSLLLVSLLFHPESLCLGKIQLSHVTWWFHDENKERGVTRMHLIYLCCRDSHKTCIPISSLWNKFIPDLIPLASRSWIRLLALGNLSSGFAPRSSRGKHSEATFYVAYPVLWWCFLKQVEVPFARSWFDLTRITTVKCISKCFPILNYLTQNIIM